MPSAIISNVNTGSGAVLLASPGGSQSIDLNMIVLSNETGAAAVFNLFWNLTSFFTIVLGANTCKDVYFNKQTSPKGAFLGIQGSSGTHAYIEYTVL